MMIAKNNEEQRSKVWRFVTVAASIIIILVVWFFITKLFTGNPLEGTWKSEDDGVTLTIKRDERLIVKFDELNDSTDVKVKMDYTLDEEAKTITVKVDEKSLQETIEKLEGQMTKEELKASLGIISSSFDYSIEQNVLVLAEREYGEQLVFTRE